MKRALITGITGQDGYFLSKLLLSKGYEVSGIIRRNSSMHQGTLEKLDPKERKQIKIYYGDITDNNFIVSTIEKIKPDEIYHLAAQSFVGYSFENPTFTPSPSQIISLSIHLKASSTNSLTVCCSPVAKTKSSGFSC